eukprot:TRINITY_DN32312_c0_g1_i1.p1 TRINITY_DN32312_c0_g1~~TRINITY_DN32312_c0_g1_i1.p1  ORF type:complete len:839 (+),score=180.45 TRINITY_DN32312_c0_g1_i1:53-2569(+)
MPTTPFARNGNGIPKIKPQDPGAFKSFPDIAKKNTECYNGTREDTFHTPRPSSGQNFRAPSTPGGGEKRWGLVDNMSVNDLLWVCDQTFAKTARMLTGELCENVRIEFERGMTAMRMEIAQPIKDGLAKLSEQMAHLHVEMHEPTKQAIRAEVTDKFQSQLDAMRQLENTFAQAMKHLADIEEQQQHGSKLCDKILRDVKVRAEDQATQIRFVQSQITETSKQASSLSQQARQETHDLPTRIDQRLDDLLRKHVKGQPVNVDFREVTQQLTTHSKEAAAEQHKIMQELKALANDVSECTTVSQNIKNVLSEQSTMLSSRYTPEEVWQKKSDSDEQFTQTDPPDTSDVWIQTGTPVPKKKTKNKVGAAKRVSQLYDEQEREKVIAKGHDTKAMHGTFATDLVMKKDLRQIIIRGKYNVQDYYHETGRAQMIAKHIYFEYMSLSMTVLNTLWIAIDADYNHAPVLKDAPPFFILMESLFCLYFLSELLIRFCAFREKKRCLRDFWFVFDLMINTYSVVDTWLITLILVASDSSSTGSVVDSSALRFIRLVKLFRLSRIARLLRCVPELGIIMKALNAAGRSIAVIGAFCILIVYIFAVILKEVIGASEMVEGSESTAQGQGTRVTDFTSVSAAMNTLILQGIFPENAMLVSALYELSPVLWPFVMGFIMLTSVTLMYMLIGVMVNVISCVADTEREGLQVQFVAGQLRDAVKMLGYDSDAQSPMSKEVITEVLTEPDVVRILYAVDVDVSVLLDNVYQVHEESVDKEGHGLTFSDLVDVVLNMRGSNPATVADIKTCIKSLRTCIEGELQSMKRDLGKNLFEIKHQVEDIAKDSDEEEDQ